MDKVMGLTFTSIMIVTFTLLFSSVSTTAIDKKYQDIADRESADLVDHVSIEGYLSERVLDEYIRRLSFKPIEMYLYHENSQGRVITNGIILDAVFNSSENVYKMEEGDFFYLEVVGPLYGDRRLITTKGGYIEHESYR